MGDLTDIYQDVTANVARNTGTPVELQSPVEVRLETERVQTETGAFQNSGPETVSGLLPRDTLSPPHAYSLCQPSPRAYGIGRHRVGRDRLG